jgi:hypothetical protein
MLPKYKLQLTAGVPFAGVLADSNGQCHTLCIKLIEIKFLVIYQGRISL